MWFLESDMKVFKTIYGFDFTSLSTCTPLLVRDEISKSDNLILFPVPFVVIIEINSCTSVE